MTVSWWKMWTLPLRISQKRSPQHIGQSRRFARRNFRARTILLLLRQSPDMHATWLQFCQFLMVQSHVAFSCKLCVLKKSQRRCLWRHGRVFFCNSGLITCLHLHDQQTLVQAFKSATILETLSNSPVCSQCLWTISDFIDVPIMCFCVYGTFCVNCYCFHRIVFWYCLHTWFNLDCIHRIFILILSSHV